MGRSRIRAVRTNDQAWLMETDDARPFPFEHAKLYTGDNGHNLVPYVQPNIFKVIQTSIGDRAIVSTTIDRIDLFKQFLNLFPGPFTILVVIQQPYLAFKKRGRYTSESDKTHIQVEFFLDTFNDYISFDGFHDLWVCCESSNGKVIYDQHDWYYIYGKAREAENILRSLGFIEREVPLPPHHAHCQRHDIHPGTHELLDYTKWFLNPLLPSDVVRSFPKTPKDLLTRYRSWLEFRKIAKRQRSKK